jgi:cytochrome-b5 reductase
MLCGGTGIAPIFQVIFGLIQILQNAHNNQDSVEFSMIFCNKTSRDILMKDKLDCFSNSGNFKFCPHYTIDKMEEGWDGLVGHINKEMILKYMPPPSSETLLLLCGRKSMCKKYLTPILIELGYDPELIYIF